MSTGRHRSPSPDRRQLMPNNGASSSVRRSRFDIQTPSSVTNVQSSSRPIRWSSPATVDELLAFINESGNDTGM